MFDLLKKVIPVLLVGLFTLIQPAWADNDRGGEIPWPLSVQHVVTVENSQGLWRLENGTSTRLFNVEMKKDVSSGYIWIRVSELGPKTYTVLAWGEGYFTPAKTSISAPKSSFSNINLEAGDYSKDSLGRYITMYSNDEDNDSTYMLRMVEVETSLGNVLGLSILGWNKHLNHMLGTRVMINPLDCFETKATNTLQCYLDDL